ncbi:hypothetical protein [Natronoflexus pectinivorans]|nr:hypothetical protein [Natronoflexus pectinivorans]
MKKILLFMLLVVNSTMLPAGQIELRGTYQGENLYIKNPFAATGVGFCVYEVTVNGMTTTDEINSSAFEVDLSVFGFRLGEPITIRVNYKEGCSPNILNADVLNARATFVAEGLHIENGKLVWNTRNETGPLPFIIEQFRWNKWVETGRVDGKGVPGQHTYSAEVRLHAGTNRFRIRQVDSRGNRRLSGEITYISNKQPVTFNITSDGNYIRFSEATLYELFDGFGRIVVRGFGDRLQVANLERGNYYLNYDNTMEVFNKRR